MKHLYLSLIFILAGSFLESQPGFEPRFFAPEPTTAAPLWEHPISPPTQNSRMGFLPGVLQIQLNKGSQSEESLLFWSLDNNTRFTLRNSDPGNEWLIIPEPEGQTLPFISPIQINIDAQNLETGHYETLVIAQAENGEEALLKVSLEIINPRPKVLYIYGHVDQSGQKPQAPGYVGPAFEQMRLNDAGPEGMSIFKLAVEKTGLEIEEAYDEDIQFSDAFLDQYTAIVLASNQKTWSPGEVQALNRWVRAGGGILAFSDANFGGDPAITGPDSEVGRDSDNRLLQQFGLFFFVDQGNTLGNNLVNNWSLPHYLNSKNSETETLNFRGSSCSPIRISEEWPEKQSGDRTFQLAPFQNGNEGGPNTISDPDVGDGFFLPEQDCALAYAQIGEGRVLATFDRNTFWNKGSGTNILDVDNYRFTQKLIRWISKLPPSPEIESEFRRWHEVVLTFDGPQTNEEASNNPFLNYRLDVTFRHANKTYVVPGYYAADGQSAESSSNAGNKWRVIFRPDEVGTWTYQASFHQGENIAVADSVRDALADFADGGRGQFDIQETNKYGIDLRGKGLLRYVGAHYLQFQNGEWFLKAGADSPETLLAYEGFDDTYKYETRRDGNNEIKTFSTHIRDWNSEDPTWQGEKGKGLIGAINYLAEKGNNAISFLTYSLGGDGKNVWPFTHPDERLRYDCSKLDQWGIVFRHAETKGMYLHFKTQEEENDNNQPWALDNGEVGTERILYYRELIARYGHHLALNWNLGEENTQTQSQQQAMADYFWNHDPYQHNVVIHTDPSDIDFSDRIYNGLLGEQSVLTGASLQMRFNRVHQETLKWLTRSRDNGRKWVVANDEQNPFQTGVPPDLGWNGYDGSAFPRQSDVRKFTLWGSLMAGGSGVEYYFGYDLDENDLNCEDWRSRDHMWDYNRYALEFFRYNKIPFWEMENRNDLIGNPDNTNDAYCLAKPGSVYLVYLPEGGSRDLDLDTLDGSFQVFWYNPREGGSVIQSNTKRIIGPGTVNIGLPPAETNQDWLAMIIAPELASEMASNEKSGGAPLLFRHMSLYPNPAQEKVILDFAGTEVGNHKPVIRILDQRGQLRYQKVLTPSKDNYHQIIDTKSFSPGLYFVVFQVGNEEIRKRLLIR